MITQADWHLILQTLDGSDIESILEVTEKVIELSKDITRLTLARNMLEKLLKYGVGTAEIEHLVWRMYGLNLSQNAKDGEVYEKYIKRRNTEVRRMLKI